MNEKTGSQRKFPVGFLVLLIVALAAGGALLVPLAAQAKNGDTSSLQGEAAPDFSLETVAGKTVDLGQLKGKVVVVDFWATWCPPCRASLPHVQKLSADKALADKGLVVLAVNARESKDQAQGFLTKNDYTFNVPLDSDGATMKKYRITGIPTTVIVGRDGRIKKVFIGYGGEATAKEIDSAVESALSESAPK